MQLKKTGALAAGAAGLFALAAVPSSGIAVGSAGHRPDRAEFAQQILSGPGGPYLTSAARMALSTVAGKQLSSVLPDGEQAARSPALRGPVTRARAGTLANVRVNDPRADRHQIEQTTQSETSLAARGQDVVVGYNDSQRTLLALTASSNLSGYSYSSDGGATFTDGGVLPNAAGSVNLGDPWLGADRSGNFYYSTLAFDPAGNLGVSVARSQHGRRWSTPVEISPTGGDVLFSDADKPALTVGPAPHDVLHDVVYDAWDDFALSPSFEFTTGLPVARSTDGGRSWDVTYADRQVQSFFDGCSFQQYIGAQPLTLPDGTLFVAAERIFVNDPQCQGLLPHFEQDLFVSTDGGRSFGPRRVISAVTPAEEVGALLLAPGKAIRTIEFPTLAQRGNALYVAWNDGGQGPSHIKLARSTDRGRSWAFSWATTGQAVDLQPALSADSSRLHLVYYHVTAGPKIDVMLADSPDGRSFTRSRVTTQSFPGVRNLPQFDPIIAQAYMGDYLANVLVGGHVHMAWGDNRDTVRNWLWPHGRHDPDVFFAKR